VAPEAVTVTVVVPPLHRMDPAVALTTIAEGSVIVIEVEAVHPLASVRTTEYVPEVKPEKLPEVWGAPPLRLKEYGAKPPDPVSEKDPSFPPLQETGNSDNRLMVGGGESDMVDVKTALHPAPSVTVML